jgi:large subunit ribosomal protein L3
VAIVAKGILGKKIGMTQIFSSDGKVVPVTVVEASPNRITQVKSVESDGYNALQVGVGVVKDKKVTKAQKGHFEKANVKPVRFIREFRLPSAPEQNAGDTITVDIFAAGEMVDVVGTSKGKGFAGTIKRHNFSRGPMGHGSKSHREPGSMGPRISGGGGKVFKGKKLPGRMGGEQVTVQRLTVARVDSERNLILIKGAIPGPKNGNVLIRNTVKPPKVASVKGKAGK